MTKVLYIFKRNLFFDLKVIMMHIDIIIKKRVQTNVSWPSCHRRVHSIDDMWHLNMKEKTFNATTCVVGSFFGESQEDWQKKFGVVESNTWSHELSIHPTHGSRRHGRWFNFDQQEEPIFYEGCAFGKRHQNPFPKTKLWVQAIELVGVLVHIDVVG
jgi:hypothetical protein